MAGETGLPIQISVSERASMELDLDTAVHLAIRLAMKEGLQGVLVTRHNYTSFTVDLSNSVPYGLTRERQEFS